MLIVLTEFNLPKRYQPSVASFSLEPQSRVTELVLSVDTAPDRGLSVGKYQSEYLSVITRMESSESGASLKACRKIGTMTRDDPRMTGSLQHSGRPAPGGLTRPVSDVGPMTLPSQRLSGDPGPAPVIMIILCFS